MNSLKFRVWDKVNKRMISSEKIVGIDFENECIGYRENKGDKIITFFPKFKDIKFMQSTNLPDKNKAEIFEGDIIECWSEGVRAIGEVKRRIDGWWFMYPAWQKGIMWGLCPNSKGETTVKVIGNIYENPELLEGVEQ